MKDTSMGAAFELNTLKDWETCIVFLRLSCIYCISPAVMDITRNSWKWCITDTTAQTQNHPTTIDSFQSRDRLEDLEGKTSIEPQHKPVSNPQIFRSPLKRIKQRYVTLEHKTSHKGPFLEVEIYASSKRWINHISIDVWFVMIRQYFNISNLRVQKHQNIENSSFKVVQIKFLAMHITNQKLS